MPFIGPWEIALIGAVVIIIFLYRILRKRKPETKICIGCGRNMPINSKFCAECGYNFLGRPCPKCGVNNPSSNRYCFNCSEKLT